MNNLVSIIVRTHSKNKIHLLEQTIDSICRNSHENIEIVIVVQTKDTEFIEQVREVGEKYRNRLHSLNISVNWSDRDERAKNLNLGIQAAMGRYIGFLDEDDIYYENHISSLLSPLLNSDSIAWSYGDILLAISTLSPELKVIKKSENLPYKRSSFSLDALFKSNYIPINSYLLDKERVESSLLAFDESFTVGEDYAFILRLASRHEPFYVESVIGEYRIFEDFSNSTLLLNEKLGVPDKHKIKAWNYALWRTEVLKESLKPDYKSGILSLKLRKYIFYKFPGLKVWLDTKVPRLRDSLNTFFKGVRVID
jgi:glycosyltransferase involved in cell wall biosynthesis